MTTKHYRKNDGQYIGAFVDGATPPAGAVECTAPTNGKAKWVNDTWEIEIDADQVKAEAERRILAIMPVHKQRNNIARGLELTGKYGADPTQWPEAEKAEYLAVIAQWKSIEAIRNKSNDLEKLKPIPEDYTDDKHW